MGLGMMICFRLKVETIIIPFRLIPIFLCFNLVQSPIVLASHDNENDRKLALDLGANAYFSKPYHEQELMTALQQMVI
jgi:CheY-like chemotaxis protein